MPQRRPILDRFWEKVIKGTLPTDCWRWSASKSVDGYGWLGNGKHGLTKAHRFSWELHNGSIPTGLNVLHKCDFAECSNPNHLYLGTQKDNNMDRAERGWRPVGIKNGRAVLDSMAVKDIRLSLSLGETPSSLAKKYGVSRSTISDIRFRRSWRHIA